MRVRAAYALLEDGGLAAMEMAAAAGLPLLTEAQRNPMLTTTRGLGELLLDAARRGAGRVVLGVGGSATVDGGAGMAAAMGWRLADAEGSVLEDGGGALRELERIEAPPASGDAAGQEVRVACDVDSPLLGEEGAARVFGPQKGATPEMVEKLEAGLARLAECLERDLGRAVARLPGAGAAGGLGAGLAGFLGAELVPGAQLVMDALDFDARLDGADLLVTGEGCLDGQSLRGKAPAAAARRAMERGVPAVALAGSVGLGGDDLRDVGIHRAWALTGLADAEECMARPAELLEQLAGARAGEIRELVRA
jgi:glycerate kinase